jgi:hypothetical protein
VTDPTAADPEAAVGGAHAAPRDDQVVDAESGLVPSSPATLAAPPAPRHGLARPVGKVRHPLGCWLLVFVTLGIYLLFWYYNTNRELRDYDSSIKVKPGLAVLSLFVPIVGLVSMYNTGKRIAQAQVIAGLPSSASGGLGVVLSFIVALEVPYYISNSNAVWREADKA